MSYILFLLSLATIFIASPIHAQQSDKNIKIKYRTLGWKCETNDLKWGIEDNASDVGAVVGNKLSEWKEYTGPSNATVSDARKKPLANFEFPPAKSVFLMFVGEYGKNALQAVLPIVSEETFTPQVVRIFNMTKEDLAFELDGQAKKVPALKSESWNANSTMNKLDFRIGRKSPQGAPEYVLFGQVRNPKTVGMYLFVYKPDESERRENSLGNFSYAEVFDYPPPPPLAPESEQSAEAAVAPGE